MDGQYFWTQHALFKMKQYALSEQRVKRVIRAPFRVEEGIVPRTIAVMTPAGNFILPKKDEKPGWKQEIWVMYQVGVKSAKLNLAYRQAGVKSQDLGSRFGKRKIKIISAWRYPGVSPKNNPIPEDVLRDIVDSI